MIDLWASWCLKCLADLPHTKQLYERYHDDGLEMLGINLDDTRQEAVDVVRGRHIPWPQIFFANQGPHGQNNPILRQYDIRSVPEMVLVNPEGKVVAGAGSARELEPAVAALLGKEGPETEADEIARSRARIVGFLLGFLLGGSLGTAGGGIGGALVQRQVGRGFRNSPKPI
ncbi:MAG: TlpA family protein disulfide reductase [Gemmataceae bacterium]|nr:TlpA family protein disulfide reductase [Gemmataceae bacterium]